MEALTQFMSDDHDRLDRLLEAAGSCGTAEQVGAYDIFRRGLLKHIGIEEKILFPLVPRLRGTPLEQAPRLRLDHGALVALLMPIPTPTILGAIRTILAAHNPIEEGPSGVYEICAKLAEFESDELIRKIRAAPEVPTNPNLTTPRILDAARRALTRAGYDPGLLDD